MLVHGVSRARFSLETMTIERVNITPTVTSKVITLQGCLNVWLGRGIDCGSFLLFSVPCADQPEQRRGFGDGDRRPFPSPHHFWLILGVFSRAFTTNASMNQHQYQKGFQRVCNPSTGIQASRSGEVKQEFRGEKQTNSVTITPDYRAHEKRHAAFY